MHTLNKILSEVIFAVGLTVILLAGVGTAGYFLIINEPEKSTEARVAQSGETFSEYWNARIIERLEELKRRQAFRKGWVEV